MVWSGPNLGRTTIALLLVALMLVPGGTMLKMPVQGRSPGSTPNGNAPWWVHWSRDMDGNHIDSELEHILDTTAPTSKIRVLLDYGHRPGAKELFALKEQDINIVYACKYIDTVIVQVEAGRVYDLTALPGVVMLEADLPIESTLDSAERSVGVDVIHGNWSYNGDGVVIGIVDTGIDVKHMGLDDLDDVNDTYDPKVIGFYDAKNNPNVLDGSYTPYDDDGHGSHVSGIASGTGAGSQNYKYVGVAPGTKLVGIKVLGPSDNSMSDAERGLEWARDNKEKYNIRVLSLSFGAIFTGGSSNDGTSSISRLCDGLVEDGFVVVVAAGNSGPRRKTIAPPGDAREVITVGNVYDDQSLNPSSSRGPVGSWTDNYIKPDVCAPGTDVFSVQANTVNNYTSKTGTSMSAPFVSGVVALMFQIDSSLSPPKVKDMLASTAGGEIMTPLEGSPNNDYGFGVIRPLDLVTNMTNGEKPPTVTVDSIEPLVRGKVRITGSAHSDAEPIIAVEVEFGSGQWEGANGVENWQYDWDTTTVQNGNVELRFRSYDGNLYSVITRKYVAVNNIQINTSLPAGATFLGNSSFKGTTHGLVVKRVDVQIDDGPWNPAEDTSVNKDWSSWEYGFTTKNLKSGRHQFTIRAFDGYAYTVSKAYEFVVQEVKPPGLKVTPGFELPLLVMVFVIVILFRYRPKKLRG